MPHPVQEAISYARAAIAEVGKHEQYLANIPDIRKANLALCETYAKQLSDKTDQANRLKAELNDVERKVAAAKRIELDEKTRSDNDIDQKIATRQATLNEVEVALRGKQQALVAIDASKQSLYRRLNLGTAH